MDFQRIFFPNTKRCDELCCSYQWPSRSESPLDLSSTNINQSGWATTVFFHISKRLHQRKIFME